MSKLAAVNQLSEPIVGPANGPPIAVHSSSASHSTADPSPPTARLTGKAAAVLVSLVLHTLLLVILASLVFPGGLSRQSLNFVADFSRAAGDVGEFELVAEPAAEVEALESEALEQLFSQEVELKFEFDGPASLEVEVPRSTKSGVAAALVATSVGEIAGQLSDATSERAASFFGTHAYGNRFVYVLDSSASMYGVRWRYACDELIKSLHSLSEDQEFYVICFDEKTTPLFGKYGRRSKFENPDDKTVRRVRSWLGAHRLGGSTMPAEALLLALKLNPDAIFFLSDGELKDNSRMMLRQMNGFEEGEAHVPIHAIHLFSQEGFATLEVIAMENGGSFTHVDDLR